jgi:hypothetical protein
MFARVTSFFFKIPSSTLDTLYAKHLSTFQNKLSHIEHTMIFDVLKLIKKSARISTYFQRHAAAAVRDAAGWIQDHCSATAAPLDSSSPPPLPASCVFV